MAGVYCIKKGFSVPLLRGLIDNTVLLIIPRLLPIVSRFPPHSNYLRSHCLILQVVCYSVVSSSSVKEEVGAQFGRFFSIPSILRSISLCAWWCPRHLYIYIYSYLYLIQEYIVNIILSSKETMVGILLNTKILLAGCKSEINVKWTSRRPNFLEKGWTDLYGAQLTAGASIFT